MRILLDGWDEVGDVDRKDWELKLYNFASHYEHGFNRILLTSRLPGYVGTPIPAAHELELIAFDFEQVRNFVEVWFGASPDRAIRFLSQLQQCHTIRGLARIPLMLALMCRVFEENDRAFPARRCDLYEHCLAGLLRNWKQERDSIDPEDVKSLSELVESVALDLFVSGRPLDFEECIQDWQRDRASRHGEVPNKLVMEDAGKILGRLKKDGLLIRGGGYPTSPWIFLHATFHEYMVAKALHRRIRRDGWKAVSSWISGIAWSRAGRK